MQFFQIKFPKTDFINHRKITYIISLSLIIIGIIAMIIHGGLRYGIDFTGGIVLQVHFDKAVSIDKLRDVVNAQGYQNAIIQHYGSPNDFLITFQGNIEQENDTIGPEIIAYTTYPNPTAGARDVAIKLTAYDSQSPIKNIFIRSDIYNSLQPVIAEDIYDKKEETGNFTIVVSNFNKDTIISIYAFAVDYVNNKGKEKEIKIHITKDNKVNSNVISSWKNENYTKEIIKTNFSPSEKLIKGLKDNFKDANIRIDREEIVGPSVSKELQKKSLWVVLLGLLGILIYVWIRFTFRFGVAAVLALFHDVLITVGIFALFNKEITIPIIAALLTLIGYSINDSIVISDRIRENTKLLRKEKFKNIINISLNQTLSRTIITSLTTLIVLLCLYLFGGPVIHDFAFALIIGVIVGTYSSIYILSPIVYDWEKKFPKKVR